MALTRDPFDVFGREAPTSEPAPAAPSRGIELRLSRLRQQLAGLEQWRTALEETARSVRRTHDTLPRTRPLTGRADTDEAVATTLIAFPWALDRIVTRLGVVGMIVDACVSGFERANAIGEDEVRQCGERLER